MQLQYLSRFGTPYFEIDGSGYEWNGIGYSTYEIQKAIAKYEVAAVNEFVRKF
jgi:hypothetical protein